MPLPLRPALLAFAAALLAALLPAQSGPPPHPRYEDIFGHALPPQKTVLIYGQPIAYYDMGAGRPGEPVLVLLHGFGSQADVDFGPSLPALSRSRRVIALDQVGSGNSAKPYISYHVQTYVEWLGEFLRTLGITRFDLCGESLGGWTAAAYAEQSLAPGSTLSPPRHLVLVGAAGFEAPAGPIPPMHMTVSTVQETLDGLRAVFYNKALVTPEVAKRRFISKMAANDAFAAATFSTNPQVRGEAVGSRAAGIAVPTLLYWGADDTLVPVQTAHAFAKAIPGATLHLAPHTGHVPPLESPKEFVETVQQFLNGKESQHTQTIQ